MAATLQQLLAAVQVSEPDCAGGLQVFGLRWDADNGLGYSTLDDALATKTLEVTEVSEDGSVPALLVDNKADSMVLIVAGEHLVGAKQNRVMNASVMVAGRSRSPIPVSCVEQGCWGYRSRKFHSAGSSSHSYLRAKMSKSSLHSYRQHGQPSADQQEVWQEVSRKLGAVGSVSSTSALEIAYQDHASNLAESLRDVRVPDDCDGVAFAFGGRVAGVDLFDKPATMAKLLPKLVQAYAIDALEKQETSAAVNRAAVEEWVRSAATATFERYDSPGLGDDMRIESNTLVGAALVVEDRPVHVELFPQDNAQPQGSR